MARSIAGYLIAVIATYVLGALFISQGNIASVIEMGFEVTFAQRLEAAFHDVTHMAEIYMPVIAVSMIIALPVATVIIKWVPNLRLVGYVLAGVVGLLAIHIIIKALVGISGIAPTRTMIGLLAQGLAGGLGGLVFHYVTLVKGDNKK